MAHLPVCIPANLFLFQPLYVCKGNKVRSGRESLNQPPGLIKALSGDRQALEELVCFCYPPVSGYLLRLTGSRERAADLAQDVMVRMLESLETYRMRPGAGFLSWVFRIARNRFIDDLRRRGREAPLPVEYASGAAGPDGAEAAIQNLEADRLRQALRCLSSTDRELLELRWFHGFSHREIAQIHEVATRVVKSRLNAALTRLRRQYAILEKGNGNADAIDHRQRN
jgi:RNA polymerase sigma-70 factor (ECF subfamily)